jgi:multisubunit Na+/H+ antiporter MnhE subunit
MPKNGKLKNVFNYFLNRDYLIKMILWIIYLVILLQYIIKDSLNTSELILKLIVSSIFYGFFEHYFIKLVNRIFKK